ncbi:TIGR03915 family putative DNA repair protein [Cyclobacterium amurskyense]|uniref:Domain often clustered or fused with uracil-DNA glycosylase n=1 Tax=Cyclobacterium amurskyense TaxID=320787 RepID=A0A0H4PCT4_9BACT|nr:TIGR03915 family putative DNA repair protein [Cyclobacterium amurskyense]AKP52271.1 Domain often clustered or fused with uracil-DNA glycosylase [Cyclobacterium amurskyense]|tara:strand:- start:8929 stop:9702 length:774 start_codon:yes stop_codon:yes gene_type:complete
MLNLQDSILVYDGSFDGFLTCVFQVYDLKLKQVIIQKDSESQASLFGKQNVVAADPVKADRVWKGLGKKTSNAGRLRIYYGFLSEKQWVENLLLRYIQYIFESSLPVDSDFSNPDVLELSKVAKSVGREKHRMEAFVRFRLTKDGLYFATIEPDFDVLPLISKHFKSRYADQKWVIYDLKRNYGLYYDLDRVEIINLTLPEGFDASKTSPDYFAVEEIEFQTLWKDYFESTNIPSRKNIKLHVRHVPKRYWKYLSEK